MVQINPHLDIEDQELSFVTGPSSGPGGQNVNKVETRVTLYFDVDASPALSDEQKELLHQRLGGRIDKRGVLRVTSQRHRTQGANREAVVERFSELLREALAPRRKRRPSRPSSAARRRRLAKKRRRSEVKRLRQAPGEDA